jgi:hypothetical protein
LFEKRMARDSARLRSYNQLLNQIYVRIKHTSQLPGNPNYVLYTVPPFILGLPSMDLQDCIVYLVHTLRTGGFEVRFTYPNLLYISWAHYEQEYMRESNPIFQAMKPIATSKKGAGGKRGTGGTATAVTFATAPGGQGLGTLGGRAAAPRSAAEYVPPDSFLDSVQRPPPGPGKPTDEKKVINILNELWNF